MNSKTLSIAVIAAVATMLIATSAVATQDAFAGKKREYNQATAQVNDCGNGKLPLNVFCQNVDSQVQGEENVVTQSGSQSAGEGN
jgi:uncharacterized membrane protein